MNESRQVGFIIFPGFQTLDLTGPLEVFAGVSEYVNPGYDLLVAAVDPGSVVASSGLEVWAPHALDDLLGVDTLIVVGGEGTRSGPHLDAIATWLTNHASQSRRVVSVCTGAMLLAEAGLLDGLRATTHWKFSAQLARKYPSVRVDSAPIFVRDGKVSTSAGVTAGIDLALALLEEDHGREISLAVARELVMYLQRPGGQAQFSAALAVQTAERLELRELQHWIAQNPSEDLRVEALAARAAMSPRHFARAFVSEIGCTPARFVERVRLEKAQELLERTSKSLPEISRACGIASTETLRKVFQRNLGVAPGEYRSRFSGASEELHIARQS